MKRYRAFLIVAGVLVIAIVAGALLLGSRGSSGDGSYAPPQPDPKPTPSVVITVEEFSDYQCQACAQLHPALKELKQEVGPKLNLVFRNLPLSNIHRNALAAAQTAEAARMQNRFWEMHDLLFQSQDLWKDEKNPRSRFLKFAADLGLDTARFQSDLENEQVRFRIEADRDAAVRLGIDSTPTIVINGRKLKPEATNPEGIREGVELMISRQRESPTGP